MKNLLSLFCIVQLLLTLLGLSAIALSPFYIALDTQYALITAPVLFIMMAIFCIYFDQKVIQWRKQLLSERKAIGKRKKYRTCLLHGAH
ncbi:hypothetical protein ACFSJY_12830 [Thalassotalea euphylliae]|uniref:hypothetical protein n=1 Tax=Thalassotalea euphylliae TaxID=1655234 RepID=UPI00363123B1